MISFAPFVEYKMDRCYLTELECVGLLVRLMADWDDDRSCDVLSAIYDGSWTHRYDNEKNQTEYKFGGNGIWDDFYSYTAVFSLTPDREKVKMNLYFDNVDYDDIIYTHTFNEDEEMGFIDFLTYRDPKKLENHAVDDDWDMK